MLSSTSASETKKTLKSATNTPPSPPTSFTATPQALDPANPATINVNLSWATPVSPGANTTNVAATLEPYKIESSTDNGQNWTEVKTGIAATATAETIALAVNTEYRLRLTATNSNTDTSETVITYTTPGGEIASSGTTFTLAQQGTGFAVAITAPTNLGTLKDGKTAATLKGYRIEYSLGTTFNANAFTTHPTDTPTNTNVSVVGLSLNTDYSVRVIVINSANKEEIVASKTVKTIASEIDAIIASAVYWADANDVATLETTITNKGSAGGTITVNGTPALKTFSRDATKKVFNLDTFDKSLSFTATPVRAAAIVFKFNETADSTQFLFTDDTNHPFHSVKDGYFNSWSSNVIGFNLDGASVTIDTDPDTNWHIAVMTLKETGVKNSIVNSVGGKNILRNWQGFKGEVGEFMLLDSPLTDAQLTLLSAELAKRWDVTKDFTVAPDPPTNFTAAANAGTSKIDLSWTAVTTAGKNKDNLDDPIAKYIIEYSEGTTAVNETAKFTLTTADATTITASVDVSFGVDYAFRIITETVSGARSTPSAVQTAKLEAPKSPNLLPNAPSGLTVIRGADKTTALNLTWTAPTFTGTLGDTSAATIQRYVVSYKKAADANYIRLETNNTTFTLTGLAFGTSYDVTVSSVNNNPDGTYAESKPTAAQTIVLRNQLPSPVSNLTGTKNTAGTEITLTWTPITEDQLGTSADKATDATSAQYIVTYTSTAGLGQKLVAWTENSVVLDSLDPNLEYTVAVVTKNNLGLDSNSVTETFTGDATAPQEIIAPSVTPVTANGTAALDVSFSPPLSFGSNYDGTDATIKEYQVQYAEAQLADNSPFVSLGTNTSGTLTGLKSNVVYDIRVKIINSANLSSYSLVTQATPKLVGASPTAPEEVTARNTKDGTLLLWAAPSNTGTNANGYVETIDKYLIEYSEGTSIGSNVSQQYVANVTSYVFTNLLYAKDYAFQVTAITASEVSSPASTATTITTPVALQKPDAPTSGNAYASESADGTSNASQGITLEWKNPTNTGRDANGAEIPIATFIIESTPVAGLPTTGFAVGTNGLTGVAGQANSLRIEGLQEKTAYTFTIRTQNAAGTSDAALTITQSTPTAFEAAAIVAINANDIDNLSVVSNRGKDASLGLSASNIVLKQNGLNNKNTLVFDTSAGLFSKLAFDKNVTAKYFVAVVKFTNLDNPNVSSIFSGDQFNLAFSSAGYIPESAHQTNGYVKIDGVENADLRAGGWHVVEIYAPDGLTTNGLGAQGLTSSATKGLSGEIAGVFIFQDKIDTTQENSLKTFVTDNWKLRTGGTVAPTATGTATNGKIDSVTLTIPAPTDAGTTDGTTAASIDSYKIAYSAGAAYNSDSATVIDAPRNTGGDTVVEIGGLSENTEHTFVVIPVNNAEAFGMSKAVTVKTNDSLGDNIAPSAIQDATFIASRVAGKSDTALMLNWRAPNPGKVGGATGTISKYVIEYSAGTTISTTPTSIDVTGTPPATSHTITGLAPDTTYAFRIKAVNAAGDSSWSNIETMSTNSTLAAGGNIRNRCICDF